MKVSECIREIVKKDHSLFLFLQKGLINISALSSEIKPEVDKKVGSDVNISTITMALRRFLESEKAEALLQQEENNEKKISYDVVLTSDICSLNVKASAKALEHLVRFSKIVGTTDAFFNITLGGDEISIVTSAKNKVLLEEMFSHETILSKRGHLSSVVITFQKGFVETEGVIYKVLKCLYYENINVYEVYSTHNKLTLVVAEEDESRAYGVIKNFL